MKRSLFFISGILCLSIPLLAGDNPQSVQAVRTETSPHIDGILDESVWQQAIPVTEFTQRNPDEGKPASEQTEFRILYDDEALYIGCMLYDSEPDKIVARLTRRDDEIESDRASIRIDSYHDHQTGYEFTFNAAGVKIDILQYDDANKEDESWDPVWDVQTKILPTGWSAEVKIPFRVLRYRTMPPDSENVWGINFIRIISRKQEDALWAFIPKSQTGFISRFGHLRGLRALPDPRPVEVLPFITARQSYEPQHTFVHRTQKFLGNAGVDIKYGISSSFTFDATINPDFGQVEADPAVLNLSTFETFYPEKRPFFIEGTQIIRFTTFGGEFGPGMFYSRRIGRALSEEEVAVPPNGRIEALPSNTTILGAAKLNGKTNSGLSVGILQAFTEEEKAVVIDSNGNRSEQVLEPFAHYNVLRLRQDVLENSNIGVIVTSVEKNSRKPAFTNGWDWNLRFDNKTYALTGFLALSHTANRNQERISGSAGKMTYSKIAGEHWLWSLSADYTSKNYNINDIGFFFSPNDYGGVASLTYKEDVPAAVVRNYSTSISLHERRTFDEITIFRNLRWSGQLLFTNYWRMTASTEVDVGDYDPFETRGHGPYRKPRNYSTSTYLFSDERGNVTGKLGQRFVWDSRMKFGSATEFGIEVKPVSWMTYELEIEYQRILNQEAWAGSVSEGALFGDRTTEQLNFVFRSTVTFTRDLTLQWYSQLFLAKGHFANYRLFVRESDFTWTSTPYNYDFNRQSLNTNLVLRWEYLPGSIVYLVWSHARGGENSNYFTSAGNDFDETFRLAPSNVLLLKATYWWSL